MDGYSVWTQENVHKYIFGQTPDTMPSTFYIALSTSSFNPDGTGIAEPGVGGYQRKDAPKGEFSAPGTATYITTTQNIADITFIESTGSWGTITDFGAFSSGGIGTGDLIFGGALDTPKTIETATIAVFSIGDLKLSTKNTP